jgi:cytochrome P450
MPGTMDSMMKPYDAPFLDVLDPTFDFLSPEAKTAQRESWYANSPVGLLVLRYAESQELLRDRRLNHNGKRYMEMNGVFGGPAYDWFVPMIVNHDGEDHRRLRGLVNKAFTPRMINNLRPFIRANAEEFTENMASSEESEFVEEFANKLPLAVMCRMLGVAPEDYETFRTWTTDLGLVFGLAAGNDVRLRVDSAVLGLNDYVDGLVRIKRDHPADDLISALVAAQAEDGRVSPEELRNLLVTLVFAAHDTTRHQLANSMVAFAAHPDQWVLLGERPELADQAVEEVIRWLPSTGTLYRFAGEDFDYQELHIERDAYLTICTILAQRDPRVFADGDRFDCTVRRDAGPLQFGGGPHHCLGAALARIELSEALPVLARKLSPPAVIGRLTWRGPFGIRGPETLPLSFT